LANDLDIPVVEEDIDPFDAYVADEVFLTSTSLCICGVATVNGNRIADGSTPRPITKSLTDAYVDLVNFDWVSQYTSRLEPEAKSGAMISGRILAVQKGKY